MNTLQRLSHGAALATVLASPALAGGFDYELVPLGQVPGAFSTVATGFNDQGTVVGWSQFSTAPVVRAWSWTEATGITLLPRPPGLSLWRAVGVNNAGVIAGDGGGDGGEAWRFEDGNYELLGTVGNDPYSTAAAINELGDVVGSSRTFTITMPPETFLAMPGAPMTSILGNSQGRWLNDLRQVVGYAGSIQAFRATPGVGVEFLPPLGSRVLTIPTAINSSGDVAGYARFANGNGSVPFLFTDVGGMQQIGNFGGSASAYALNDRGELVGNYQPSGGPQFWIWTAHDGLRFLNDRIDTSLGLGLVSMAGINERGEILVGVLDLTTAERQPALLVPIAGPAGADTPASSGGAPRRAAPR